MWRMRAEPSNGGPFHESPAWVDLEKGVGTQSRAQLVAGHTARQYGSVPPVNSVLVMACPLSSAAILHIRRSASLQHCQMLFRSHGCWTAAPR
jgi:hypothetical protein